MKTSIWLCRAAVFLTAAVMLAHQPGWQVAAEVRAEPSKSDIERRFREKEAEIRQAERRKFRAAFVAGIIEKMPAEERIGDDVVSEDALSPDPRTGLASEIFDHMLMGATGRDAVAAVQMRMNSDLQRKIGSITHTCGLTDAQKRKLQLAGRGDIKRIFDRIEEKRKTFQIIPDDGINQLVRHQIRQSTEPLCRVLRSDMFGDGTLFAKTLKSMLTPEQSAAFEQKRTLLEHSRDANTSPSARSD